jgi:hypothetical protein
MRRARPPQHGSGIATKLPTILLAFALLCVGVLLLSQHFGAADASYDLEGISPTSVGQALDALSQAELALSRENYGEARAHLGRARSALQPSNGHEVD